nr:NAD-dependent protein deacylase [Clostridia bacterium]
VFELHGSVHRNSCTRCRRKYTLEYVVNQTDVPLCECGAVVKPDVVLYGESLDQQTMRNARRALSSCDLLIVGGTSLTVYPAAGLIEGYRGKRLVLINKTETPRDDEADLVIHMGLGEVFSAVL